MIGIIDYGMGNLGSVVNACRFLGIPAEILTTPESMASCGGVILPGVGSFGDCMAHLDGHGFTGALRQWIGEDRPFLGICLGLQALFESSEESPGVAGLGVIRGSVRRFRIDPALKVPQMGWNGVRQQGAGDPMFKDIQDGAYFYFVHSFHAAPEEADVVAGVTEYGMAYCSAVRQGRTFAVQFHPEKSQAAGLQMLRNFGASVERTGGAA